MYLALCLGAFSDFEICQAFKYIHLLDRGDIGYLAFMTVDRRGSVKLVDCSTQAFAEHLIYGRFDDIT